MFRGGLIRELEASRECVHVERQWAEELLDNAYPPFIRQRPQTPRKLPSLRYGHKKVEGLRYSVFRVLPFSFSGEKEKGS